MSYAMKSRCALDNQCNATGVLVVIMDKSAKDDQHPFQQRSGMICLCQIRKTTSTVVILQAGPWAFSWLTLCSTESCSTLSESLWTCSVLFANQNFSFRIIVSRICTLQSEKTVCMEYKNESGTFAKKEWPGAQPGCPYLLFLLTAIIVFVLAILLGRALWISYRNWSQLCAVYSAVYSANNGE